MTSHAGQSLKLAPSLSLPAEAALQRFGILAMSGAGKSNASVVFAEQMYHAGIPWVAIDPKGDWWGIRSSADGTKPGLPVPVFGGLEGDIPLEEGAGKLMAELIASKRLTCVLDVSEFPSRAAQMRFLTDFAETMLRKNRSPIQLLCEEADEYLPERVMKSEARCVGAWSRLVKRGRFRGVFVTLITQRSAALNKNALSQIDTLIPMRMADPRDKKAIKLWVTEHDVDGEMFASLPQLDDGEAWIWSPQKLKLTERIKFDRRQTFDSGATPDWDDRPAATRADIDLDAFREEMASTMERVKADDPVALRAEIRALEKKLAAKPTSEKVEVEKVVEVPARPSPELVRAAKSLPAAVQVVRRNLDAVDQSGMRIAEEVGAMAAAPVPRRASRPAPRATTPRRESPHKPPPPPGRDDASQADKAAARTADPERFARLEAGLSDSQQRILDALAALEAIGIHEAHKTQVALFAKASPKSSGYQNNLGALRNQLGLISYPGPSRVALTDEGRVLADSGGAPQTVGELHDFVAGLLSEPKWAIVQALIDYYPEAIGKAELAEDIGVSASSSGYQNNLGSLRSLGLIDYPAPGTAAALPVLFMEAA